MNSLGLTIFSGGRGAERFRRAAEIAALAEEAGFDAVWTGELYNRSATVPMAMLAAGTSPVRISSNIACGAGRSPLIWAAEARDLDELSEGRVVLGLGNGTRGMLENWLSVSGDAPAARMPGEPLVPTAALGSAVLEPGWPTRAELAARYAAATGRDLADLRWYTVLALWKLAVLFAYSRRRGADPYYDDPALVTSFLDAAATRTHPAR